MSRYSQIGSEALAIVCAVERFHDYLYGISFTIVTDNKPLMNMLSPDSKKILPPRIQRLFWRLLQYKYRFKHVDGKHNIADSMSRLPCTYDTNTVVSDVCDEYVRFILQQGISEIKAVTLENIRRETANDEFLSKLSASVKSGKWSEYRKHKAIYNMQQELFLFEWVILRGDRIVIPSLGIVMIKQLLRPKFYWFGMDKDIERFVSSCEICAVNQPLNLNTPLQPDLLPNGPWKKGAVDILGPIENRYILTYID